MRNVWQAQRSVNAALRDVLETDRTGPGLASIVIYTSLTPTRVGGPVKDVDLAEAPRSAHASDAESSESSPARTSHRRTLATSAGIMWGAASWLPKIRPSAQRPAGPLSMRAATTTDESTTSVNAVRCHGARESDPEKSGSRGQLPFTHSVTESRGVWARGQLDQLMAQILLERAPRLCGPRRKLVTNLHWNIPDGDRCRHACKMMRTALFYNPLPAVSRTTQLQVSDGSTEITGGHRTVSEPLPPLR